ncbi:MAG: DNA translocase FtsK 4TM domain-containing protein, partial [Hydrogenophaga sp.]|nr:DNA translocase FtsK 4TM domain-containing protein [Hydrogenophaga sp.]
MTYSLNTLNADRAQAAPGGVARFTQEIGLVVGAAALAFWLLALLSHSLIDPAWSTTGSRSEVGNWGGQLGALLADASYYLLGWSVWWCFFAGLRAWLSALAGRLRGQEAQAVSRDEHGAVRWWQTPWARRLAYVLALLVLLSASVVLEWSRLYRLEPHLPGTAGGVLGHALGPVAVRWLGFTGSALGMLALLVICLPRVFRFSWGQWAEHLGAWLDNWVESRREKRETVEDQRIGEMAAREREEVVKVERVESEEHHPTPVLIEPTLVDVPKSERVAKERQKPLFVEMPDSKLPQV